MSDENELKIEIFKLDENGYSETLEIINQLTNEIVRSFAIPSELLKDSKPISAVNHEPKTVETVQLIEGG